MKAAIEWLAGICFVLMFAEGMLWALFTDHVARMLSQTPRHVLRLAGLIQAAVALALIIMLISTLL